jgi:hypothetical protein
VTQAVLGYQSGSNSSNSGLISMGRLPLYLDLIQTSGLGVANRQQMPSARMVAA